MKFFVPFLFALCFHEFAHGLVAKWKGDRTAETMGRLTLNPAAHADPLGTVIFPIMGFLTQLPLFGWAKPVPVDERNLKNPKKDMFWISIAGPMSNLLLAFVAMLVLTAFYYFNMTAIASRQEGALQIEEVIHIFILLNTYLAIFNLIPVHPLDGGKVIARFLPNHVNQWLENNQMYTGIILMLIFLSGAAALIGLPARFLSSYLVVMAHNLAFAL
ncbi:MAG: site-2 protease family protein [Proteobacteria bacterium]|nr:MAG: site-2 protease family protein [Pseudomonadota bacterium]